MKREKERRDTCVTSAMNLWIGWKMAIGWRETEMAKLMWNKINLQIYNIILCKCVVAQPNEFIQSDEKEKKWKNKTNREIIMVEWRNFAFIKHTFFSLICVWVSLSPEQTKQNTHKIVKKNDVLFVKKKLAHWHQASSIDRKYLIIPCISVFFYNEKSSKFHERTTIINRYILLVILLFSF